jgi:2-hydroxychromene-2-carboxylate isomerase
MHHLSFWFDPISPYAHLAFEHLPQALEGHSVVIDYKPVLFGALLKHHQHKGPAEIEPKRVWTFRQIAWHAHTLGIRVDLPAQHPFNPLPLLRLLLAAAGPMGLPNRHQVEAVFRHVWQGGGDPLDAPRLLALQDALGLGREWGSGTAAAAADPLGSTGRSVPSLEAVKARLKSLTDEALEKGIFGVPTLEWRGRLFWGLDALPMLRSALGGDPWFDREWERAAKPVPGIRREP